MKLNFNDDGVLARLAAHSIEHAESIGRGLKEAGLGIRNVLLGFAVVALAWQGAPGIGPLLGRVLLKVGL